MGGGLGRRRLNKQGAWEPAFPLALPAAVMHSNLTGTTMMAAHKLRITLIPVSPKVPQLDLLIDAIQCHPRLAYSLLIKCPLILGRHRYIKASSRAVDDV